MTISRTAQLAATRTPSAIVGRLRAHAADPILFHADGRKKSDTELTQELSIAMRDHRARVDARIAAIDGTLNTFEAAINDGALKAAGVQMGGGGMGLPVEPEYSTPFASYVRRGDTEAAETLKAANGIGERATIQAAFTEGDASGGGFLAPVEWDRRIAKAQRALSPLRRLSQVVTTGRAAYSTLWSSDGWGSGWVGESASRPSTEGARLFPLIVLDGEIYANPAATQRLIDDAAIDFEAWLSTNLSDEFSRQEGIAFVSGNGINKPMGFLQYVPGGAADFGVALADGTSSNKRAHPGGNLAITPTGDASKLTNTDALIDFKYGLGAPYRQNATWLMNSQTAAVIAKMKDAQGNYIWREALLANEPATLLGRPVEIDENMPNIAAGAFPVAFGDFSRGYLVNDRVGVRILRDPYTNKPFISFYATKRVGGGVIDPFAIRLLKVAAS